MLSHPHNCERLLSRWRSLANRLNWKVAELCRDGEDPILAIENEAARATDTTGIYLSAGVHGDECAAAWGLLQWAETLTPTDIVNRRPLVILPCLNPHGFSRNARLDSHGLDLNRNFQNDEVPVIEAWQRFLGNRGFDVALNLHEDYDANGVYLYEIAKARSIGHRLLDACESLIPRESSSEVDGVPMNRGLLNRTEDIVDQELGGWPEAIYLFLKRETDSYTFETPSEFDLERRVATHKRFIETMVELNAR